MMSSAKIYFANIRDIAWLRTFQTNPVAVTFKEDRSMMKIYKYSSPLRQVWRRTVQIFLPEGTCYSSARSVVSLQLQHRQDPPQCESGGDILSQGNQPMPELTALPQGRFLLVVSPWVDLHFFRSMS